MKRNALFTVVLFMAGMCISVVAQEEKDSNPWVYETEYQIPWSRVDSLVKLLKLVEDEYNTADKAVEMGYILDFRVYIHHTGDEWNVRYAWVYPNWESMNTKGWGTKVWEAVEPDADKRKEIFGGFNWVFEDVIHRDRIFRLFAGSY